MFGYDYIMIYSTIFTSIGNTLKKIHLSKNILNEFTSTYYDDKKDYFEMLFQNYIASAVNNIYHTDNTKEYKSNVDKVDYEHTLH